MTNAQYLKNLTPPEGKVDIIIDSDAFTEIDDLPLIENRPLIDTSSSVNQGTVL